MKRLTPSTKTIIGFLALGEVMMVVAYLLFYLGVATASLATIPAVLILVMGFAVIAGLGLNRITPESGGGARFAAWTVALAPVTATWLYAGFRPPFGEPGAVSAAMGVLLFMIVLSALFGAWSFLRAEEKTRFHLPTGAGWALAGVVAVAGLFAGGAALLLVASVLAMAAQVGSVLAMREENIIWDARQRLKPRA